VWSLKYPADAPADRAAIEWPARIPLPMRNAALRRHCSIRQWDFARHDMRDGFPFRQL